MVKIAGTTIGIFYASSINQDPDRLISLSKAYSNKCWSGDFNPCLHTPGWASSPVLAPSWHLMFAEWKVVISCFQSCAAQWGPHAQGTPCPSPFLVHFCLFPPVSPCISSFCTSPSHYTSSTQQGRVIRCMLSSNYIVITIILGT